MKAKATTKTRAKKYGIKLTIKKGKGFRQKTEAELLANLRVKINAKKKRTTAKIPKWGKQKITTAARVLGSKGGKAKAKK